MTGPSFNGHGKPFREKCNGNSLVVAEKLFIIPNKKKIFNKFYVQGKKKLSMILK